MIQEAMTGGNELVAEESPNREKSERQLTPIWNGHTTSAPQKALDLSFTWRGSDREGEDGPSMVLLP